MSLFPTAPSELQAPLHSDKASPLYMKLPLSTDCHAHSRLQCLNRVAVVHIISLWLCLTLHTLGFCLWFRNRTLLFLMWTIFNVFIEFATVLRLFYVLFLAERHVWDLSFPTSNRTHSLHFEGEVLAPGQPGKSLEIKFFEFLCAGTVFHWSLQPQYTHPVCSPSLCLPAQHPLCPTSHPVSFPIHEVSVQILSFWWNIFRHAAQSDFSSCKAIAVWPLPGWLKIALALLILWNFPLDSLPFQVSCCYCLVPNKRFSLL